MAVSGSNGLLKWKRNVRLPPLISGWLWCLPAWATWQLWPRTMNGLKPPTRNTTDCHLCGITKQKKNNPNQQTNTRKQSRLEKKWLDPKWLRFLSHLCFFCPTVREEILEITRTQQYIQRQCSSERIRRAKARAKRAKAKAKGKARISRQRQGQGCEKRIVQE